MRLLWEICRWNRKVEVVGGGGVVAGERVVGKQLGARRQGRRGVEGASQEQGCCAYQLLALGDDRE